MIGIMEFAKALSNALPEAMVLIHGSEDTMMMQRGDRLTTYPDFYIQRGYILGGGEEVPIQDPPLTAEEELDLSVKTIVQYHGKIKETVLKLALSNMHPLRTMICLNRRSTPDTIRLSVCSF